MSGPRKKMEIVVRRRDVPPPLPPRPCRLCRETVEDWQFVNPKSLSVCWACSHAGPRSLRVKFGACAWSDGNLIELAASVLHHLETRHGCQ
jgi:hypothetical protein